ncbi:hypothetical protein [Streptomyces sp. WELS2]|uniref:hypothetical protein n=1 Tax=Streptomyces sp. WELS2 TaxID=2749435 RepID=UPI0015F0F2EF|nr:hypothetical protein [Streptomyces sp. WELS2]
MTGGLPAGDHKDRHRSARLAGSSVAVMIQALAARAPQRLTPLRSLVAARRYRAVAFARTCYGRLIRCRCAR